MKYVTIGDVHGHNNWKNAVYKLDDDTRELGDCLLDFTIDKVIFVGDYVDDWKLTNTEILNNLKEIIQLKKDYPDNVILLMGNHDVAYLHHDEKITGHRAEMGTDLYQIFHENRELFQLAYQVNDVIWTHAGIHRGWWKFYALPVIEGYAGTRFNEFLGDCKNVADYLNLMYNFNYDPIFMCGKARGGTHNVGGPLWADKYETYHKPLDGYHQIVGHTRVNRVLEFDFPKNTKMTYVDCMDNFAKFHTIHID
jgi:hypothetical protein